MQIFTLLYKRLDAHRLWYIQSIQALFPQRYCASSLLSSWHKLKKELKLPPSDWPVAMWEGPVHCGWYHPWSGGLGWYKKASWESNGKQASIPLWSWLQLLPPSFPLSSCLGFPSWGTVTNSWRPALVGVGQWLGGGGGSSPKEDVWSWG